MAEVGVDHIICQGQQLFLPKEVDAEGGPLWGWLGVSGLTSPRNPDLFSRCPAVEEQGEPLQPSEEDEGEACAPGDWARA